MYLALPVAPAGSFEQALTRTPARQSCVKATSRIQRGSLPSAGTISAPTLHLSYRVPSSIARAGMNELRGRSQESASWPCHWRGRAMYPVGDSRSSAGATTSSSARAWRAWSPTSRTAPASHGAAASGTAATATTASEARTAPAVCAATATAAPAAANTASAVSIRPTSSAEICPRTTTTRRARISAIGKTTAASYGRLRRPTARAATASTATGQVETSPIRSITAPGRPVRWSSGGWKRSL